MINGVCQIIMYCFIHPNLPVDSVPLLQIRKFTASQGQNQLME
jgi:hypothetical protein